MTLTAADLKGRRIIGGLIVGAIPPIVGLLTGWWTSLPFLPEPLIKYAALGGLSVGLLISAVLIRKWSAAFFDMSLSTWGAIYLFYHIMVFGASMGVPVLNAAMALPAGLLLGVKLARPPSDERRLRATVRASSRFAVGIMVGVCVVSATIALLNVGTESEISSILQLDSVMSREVLWAVILIGSVISAVFTLFSIQLTAYWIFRKIELHQTVQVE